MRTRTRRSQPAFTFEKMKDFLITVIDKKMEYEITIANQTFDYVIIDNELEGANPIEMVLLGKGKKINKDTKCIIYQIPKII